MMKEAREKESGNRLTLCNKRKEIRGSKMLTKELLLSQKDNLNCLLEKVGENDIDLLVAWLKEKDDTIRYAAFLLLQLLSANSCKVYKYWETFSRMIDDDNSYQRSLGLMLVSENIRWDKEDKFGVICSGYLDHCDDEKFITARQCIQGLNKIYEHSTKYKHEIVDMLLKIDLNKRKDTQKSLLLMDIIEVLGKIASEQMDERVEAYLKTEYERGNDKVKKAIKKHLK